MPSVTQEELEQKVMLSREDQKKRDAQARDLVIKYKNVFNSEDGKAVLEDLGKVCGFHRSSYGNKNEPYDVIFLEGRRDVFLYIKDKVEKEL